MKESITTEIKDIVNQCKIWTSLETEYVKLTLAEKFTILTSAAVLGSVCLLIAMIVIVLLSLALVGVFEMWMQTGLAYLCVSGVVLLLGIVVFLLRKPLLYNPISRFITKLILDREKKHL